MPSYHYYQQYADYFWQWEEGGSVISIPDGTTIAYKDFVADIIEKLSDDGLPLFGSLLLAMIATNPEADASLSAVRIIIEKKLKENISREPLDSAFIFLTQIAALSPKYKKGPNRLLLLQTLFAGCHNRLAVPASKLTAKSFWKTFSIDEHWIAPKPFHYNLYHEEFTVIKLLAKKFPDNDALIAAMASLPIVEEELLLEEPEGKEADEKDFIETLVDNPKTFYVGSLVKRLWSGLNIPFHSALAGQQPLGGVSGLTNKGEVHRMLISEFANEDLIFLSRFASNEALYVNREVPPQHNNLRRIVLLDVSLKNWGTPKAVAFALLMAIARHPKTDIGCSAFALGDACTPLFFSTVDEVIQSLQVLEPSLHPATGLEKFFKEHGGEKNTEIFFISSAETLRQTALHKVLSDHASSLAYCIYTDSEGGVYVYKRRQASRKHVQHLQLPLEELWTKPPKEKLVSEEAIKSNYPILFPCGQPKKAIHSSPDNKTFVITREKDLLQLTEHNKGWAMVHEHLSFTSGDAQIGLSENGEYLLLVFHQPNRELHLINLTTGQKRTTVFSQWRSSVYKEFVFHNDKFYYAYLGFPSWHWSFEWGDSIRIESLQNIPPDLMAKLKEKEKQVALVTINQLDTKPVFKNVQTVFINQVGNLVFNIHELRLNDAGEIKFENWGFVEKQSEAVQDGKDVFKFKDGSTITVNKSGMLVLKSSNEQMDAVYVPLVLQTPLGIATQTAFAGNDYYQSLPLAQVRMTTQEFWRQQIQPFIETIKAHGA